MSFKSGLATFLFLSCVSQFSQAALVTLASDSAQNYGNQWSGNGGFGFDEWQFADFQAGGAAGTFLANGNLDLNHIATGNKAWGTFANDGNQNQGGFNQVVAYRGFANNSLQTAGDTLNVSFEHSGILGGGSVGMVLRNQNNALTVDDYNALSRFEFSFIGGDTNYSIFDASGKVDTGIGFTTSGLNLTFSLLSGDAYQLDAFFADTGSLAGSFSGSLLGAGSIDSVSLFNRNAEFGDAFFNSLSISQQSNDIPEPIPALLILMGGLWLLKRKPN